MVRIASDQTPSFVVFVILARLLSPREIGIFAIAMAFTEGYGAIAIQGMVAQNIPRAKKLTPELADTVFWTNLAMSIAVAFVVLALAPIIMGLIDLPDGRAVAGARLRAADRGAGRDAHVPGPARVRAQSLALRSVVGGTIGGGVAIAAAFAGWGIWSLVVQRFVTESMNALMSWQGSRWMPGRNFSMEQLRTIWGFGFNMVLTQILGLLPRRVLDLMIGTMIGAAAVGLYRTGGRTNSWWRRHGRAVHDRGAADAFAPANRHHRTHQGVSLDGLEQRDA